jgi:tetratricopeptide (TPR) repeat protein
MRKIAIGLTASLMLLFAAGNGFAATSSEFYQGLLRRGVSDFNAGRYDAAERELRIAAFGMVDAVDLYQTAQVYLALTSERLGHTEEARRAVDRAQAAQRAGARYPSLPLPAEVRTAFDTLVQRLLPTASEPLKSAAPNASAARPRMLKPRTQPSRPPSQPQPALPQSQASAVTPDPAPKQPTLIQREVPFEAPPVPAPAPIVVPPAPAPVRQPAQRRDLAAGERALMNDDLPTARAIYRENLDGTSDHATLMRIAEGLYRARDFAGALAAFQRAGELRAGEEPFRYYRAVAQYETGNYARARTELEAALPHIEITPDVARYRAKILAAIE